VVSFTPRLLYPQGKIPWYPLDRRLGEITEKKNCYKCKPRENLFPITGPLFLAKKNEIKELLYQLAKQTAVTARNGSCLLVHLNGLIRPREARFPTNQEIGGGGGREGEGKGIPFASHSSNSADIRIEKHYTTQHPQHHKNNILLSFHYSRLVVLATGCFKTFIHTTCMAVSPRVLHR
jgi:hypothetical protein